MVDTPKHWTKVEAVKLEWKETRTGTPRIVTSSNLHLLVHGRIRFQTPVGKGIMKAGQAMWLPAGMPFSYEVLDGPAERYTLYLRLGAWAPANEGDGQALALIHRLNRLGRHRGPLLALSRASFSQLVTLLEELHRLWLDTDSPWHRCGLKAGAVRALQVLFSDRRLLNSESPNDSEPKRLAAERVEQAIYHLNHRDYVAQPDLDIATIAKLCGYGPSQFHALFLEATGSTPQRYLTERRVALACDLLAQPDARVLEVGFAAGFNSQSRFYQAFRTIMGMAPGQWRRQQGTDSRH